MSAELTRHPPAGDAQTALPSRGITGWAIFWMLALACGFLLFLRDYASLDGLSIAGTALWGRDFVNIFTSGTLVLEGRTGLIYDVPAYRAFQEGMFPNAVQFHNYSYPPVTLLYTWLFALLPYPLALTAWLGGTGALFLRAARPYIAPLGLSGWLALLAPASLVNLWAGHYGFLIGALWLFGWRLLPGRPAMAGALIGLMIVKPHLAVLAPIVLLWRRQWVAFASAGATSVALIGLSVIFFGPDLWVTYLGETARFQAEMVDDTASFFLTMMPTLTPSLALLGIPVGWAAGLQLLTALAAIAALLRYMPQDPMEAGLATATATFLVLPYGFGYDMTVCGLAGLILFRRVSSGEIDRSALLAGLAAFAPIGVMFFNAARMPIVPLLIAFQLFALLWGASASRRATSTGPAATAS